MLRRGYIQVLWREGYQVHGYITHCWVAMADVQQWVLTSCGRIQVGHNYITLYIAGSNNKFRTHSEYNYTQTHTHGQSSTSMNIATST